MFPAIHDTKRCHSNKHIKCVCKNKTNPSVKSDLTKMIPLTIQVTIVDSDEMVDFKDVYYFTHKIVVVKTFSVQNRISKIQN